MSHSSPPLFCQWRRVLSPLALLMLLGLVQVALLWSTALAASTVPTTFQTTSPQAALPPHPLAAKEATITWSEQRAALPMSPNRSYGDWYCASSEHCYCPSDTPASSYNLCQWYAPFWPFSGGVLTLYYWLDPNLPSNLRTWATSGAGNWNGSAANVLFYSTSSQSSSNVEIDAWHPGANCAGVWGQTSVTTSSSLPGNPIQHVRINLNVDNYNNCGNNGGALWISTAAHELGHALGLEHNEWINPSTGHHMLMWSCSACNSSQQTPQSMDIQIINTMYPTNLVTPTLDVLCGGSWSYQYDNHAYNSPGNPSQAGLNTWYTPSMGTNGRECHDATWYISNSSHRCVNLRFWDPWYNSNVTTLELVIVSSDGVNTWYNNVNVDEAPTWNYINLGNFPYANMISTSDNSAGTGTNGTTSGATLAVSVIQLQWC